MSSEAVNRSLPHTKPTGSTTVSPQHVTDPSLLDSVAGFINEVVPSSYTAPTDFKDQIQWVRFEETNLNEPASPDYAYSNNVPSPLILILGYTTGVQVWAIPASGEATEILSWRHGSVRVLKILPTPSYNNHFSNQDVFKVKRPLLALADNSTPGPQYSAVNFLSLKTGEQVKIIKFKNPVLDVLANKSAVIITFQEKIAVFDALTLEDRLSVTTCYLSPGVQPNPVTLGKRWLAYAEKKLSPSKLSSGGNDGDGVHSYTATVIQAAKSLGRGLKELSESVASSLKGNLSKPGTSPSSPQAGGQSDVTQKGIVTILDIEHPVVSNNEKSIQTEAIVAHFTAHTEAIVCLEFDPSGMLLLTADKRGHDFHLFRIQPHPGGPSLAAVHHLYILHRGDTTARVQDISFAPDSRWAAVTTIRGTTHVFPITPYGGNVGMRTHATPHIVNKMSRFHRSAGLTIDGRSNSPVSNVESATNMHYPYHNPRYPPFPHPTVVHPLAQIRQPVNVPNTSNVSLRTQTGRQRLSSSSEDNISLRVATCFAPPRAWIDVPPREPTPIKQPKPVESLFIISCYGILVQYDLEPHQSSNVPKEKVCSDSPIELLVSAKAQWLLQRQPHTPENPLPMCRESLGFFAQDSPLFKKKKACDNDDQWLSQVEIVTHAGPHRRLWMGPQFTFKTYTTTGSPLSVAEAQPIDLEHTKPVNMPVTKANAVLIECSSASSCEQSLLDAYQKTFENVGGAGELQLKEDLADAMLESPGIRESGGRCVIVQMKPAVAKVVNPLGTVVNVHSDEEVGSDSCEETVIHENCDEALFRPMVVSKVVPCEERTKRYGDSIITKSLDATTEVAVKILENRHSGTPDTPRRQESNKENYKKSRTTTKAYVSGASDVNPSVQQKKFGGEKIDLPIFKEANSTSKCNSKEVKNDLRGLKKDNISLDIDNIEDPHETPGPFSNKTKSKPKPKATNKDLYSIDDSSTVASEDSTEEKSSSKKPRKPKAKLGVKIANVINKDYKTEDEDNSDTIPTAPTKLKWSSIVSSTPASEKLLIDVAEKENELRLDLPSIEFVEEFTLQLPKRMNMTSLIDASPEKESAVDECKRDSYPEVMNDDLSLLKIDKSSDEEKGSSSVVEASESDDSGKNLNIESGFGESLSSVTIPASKSSRKKKRKK